VNALHGRIAANKQAFYLVFDAAKASLLAAANATD